MVTFRLSISDINNCNYSLNELFINSYIERCARVVNTPASYSGGQEFESRLRLFVVFLSPQVIAGIVLRSRLQPLPSKSIPIHHSFITLSFDAV
jgi:hypothetical protein